MAPSFLDAQTLVQSKKREVVGGGWLFPDGFLFLMSVGEFPTRQAAELADQPGSRWPVALVSNHPASRQPHFAIKEA